MNANSEELYLEAEADIKNNNYAEAFKKYESILYEEPDSAPAHNSMGWLYKTQFDGAEFFNGFRWSDTLTELKYILHRDQKDLRQHLLETEAYRDDFYKGSLEKITGASDFKVKIQ